MLTQHTNLPTIEEMASSYAATLGYTYILSSYFHGTNKVKITYERNDNIETVYLSYDFLYNLWIKDRI